LGDIASAIEKSRGKAPLCLHGQNQLQEGIICISLLSDGPVPGIPGHSRHFFTLLNIIFWRGGRCSRDAGGNMTVTSRNVMSVT